MHTITLTLVDGNWMAQHSDPQVKRLFGTDTLPTPFTSQADVSMVLRKIRDLNPGCVVGVK